MGKGTDGSYSFIYPHSSGSTFQQVSSLSPTPISIKHLQTCFALLQINVEQVTVSLPTLDPPPSDQYSFNSQPGNFKNESTWPMIHRYLIWNAWCWGGGVGGRIRNKFPDSKNQHKWKSMGFRRVGEGRSYHLIVCRDGPCLWGDALSWEDLGWPQSSRLCLSLQLVCFSTIKSIAVWKHK